MKNAFHRNTIENVRKDKNFDLIDKTVRQREKNGKSKLIVVDKSADSEKFIHCDCIQFSIATGFSLQPVI